MEITKLYISYSSCHVMTDFHRITDSICQFMSVAKCNSDHCMVNMKTDTQLQPM